jgi:hypothetical protein
MPARWAPGREYEKRGKPAPLRYCAARTAAVAAIRLEDAMLTIAPDSTRDDLTTCLCHLVDQAKRELTRDSLGRPNARWAALHADINRVLTAMLARRPCD